MSRRYFGTDGVRGTVGTPPITADFVLRLGWAAGRVLARRYPRPRVIIGKDTRISGYMFESALEAGFSAAGVDVALLGPMPTPGIAYLTRTFRASAGVVISASHNAHQDNGIKFFSGEGTKFPDELEAEIEAELDGPLATVGPDRLGKAVRIDDAAGRYIEFCKSSVPGRFSLHGMKLVIDCANGATYHIAPSVFRELGADVTLLGSTPDGLNINQQVGSTSPETMQARVLETGADLGIAFDGDGDRVIMCDASGRLIDGDDILYMIARDRQARGVLAGGVVGTLMSNFGLAAALEKLGIPFERAKVGDRHVLERMESLGWSLGGESSGHIVCGDAQTTGDGIVSALQVLAIMIVEDRSLETLMGGYEKAPQALVNVRLREGVDKEALLASESVRMAVTRVETELGENGRVLLRPSGTEPLIRVMVEGRPHLDVQGLAETIAGEIETGMAGVDH
ncbi:phosphoglucosamine mutase [Kushneria sinocarnis]|uniref:Phosphoglucosamine mutase n=1 Tax=Kushneria sinocarnis TaxID=595502 RepID=A0A420WSR4_9GAMM|nr:phosphoglucosamine mutase [Kushneria sinocarnis]RKQ95797.1 phosphoglucosamine mutase [Kushneria sinocarnis]